MPIRGQPIRGQPIRGQPIRGQPIRGQPIRGLFTDVQLNKHAIRNIFFTPLLSIQHPLCCGGHWVLRQSHLNKYNRKFCNKECIDIFQESFINHLFKFSTRGRHLFPMMIMQFRIKPENEEISQILVGIAVLQ